MATIKFFIQGTKNPTSISISLSISRGNVFKRKTGFVIDPDKWSTDTNLPKKGGDVAQKNLKSDLTKLSSKIEERFNVAIANGIEINGEWLENQIDLLLDRKKRTDKDCLTNYIQIYMDKLPFKVRPGGKTGVSYNTIQKYTTLKKKVEEFEKHKRKKYFVKDVGLKFASDITKYFMEVDRLSKNSTGRYLKYLKTICNDAKNNGYKAHSQLSEIRGVSEQAAKVFLSFDDLDKIEKKSYNREALINAKDWLVIGCYIGQRVSDLLVLTNENIKVRNGLELIELTQKKTGKRVAIPLHPKVKEVLERNCGSFPRNISDQKFNKHIKDVCQLAEINQLTEGGKMTYDEVNDIWRKEFGVFPKWELVTTHICRRSFASNFYGEIPTALLISITGHSTESQFLGYIGLTQNDYAVQLADYWGKQSAQAKKEPQMTVLSKAN